MELMLNDDWYVNTVWLYAYVQFFFFFFFLINNYIFKTKPVSIAIGCRIGKKKKKKKKKK